MNHEVFVYGTLTGHTDGAIPAELPGFRKETGGKYPTIVPDEDAVVQGEVVSASDADLRRLDSIEGVNGAFPEKSYYKRFKTAEGVYLYVANVATYDDWPVTYDMNEMRGKLEETELKTF